MLADQVPPLPFASARAQTATEGDFRDRLVRNFATDVEKRTKGALKFEIYPGSSLMDLAGRRGGIARQADCQPPRGPQGHGLAPCLQQ